MKKRVILSTIVSLVLLIAVVAAGLNAVFTITLMDTTFRTFSRTGETQAAELEQKLSRFHGKSTTFLDLGDVESVVAEYPAFRLERIKKSYPSRVELTVAERRETFAFRLGEGYAVLDEKGVCIDADRASLENAQTGGENVALIGFDFSVQEGQVAAGEYFPQVLTVLTEFSNVLSHPRANVKRVTLRSKGDASNRRADRFDVEMSEGVVIHIFNPSVLASEKASAALSAYLQLTDGEKMYGFLSAVDTTAAGGGVAVNYDVVDRTGDYSS